jgi:uncharacterized protein YecE (DUF72 family)
MFRTLLAIILIAILAAGVWYGARWMADREDLNVTVVFKSAGDLRRGDPVTISGKVVGKVTKISPLESQDAVSIRVEKEYRNELMRDSLFAVVREGGESRLEVINTVAVGRPLEDGAVVYAREDRLTRWIARHGPAVGALAGRLEGKARKLLEDYESGKLKEELEQYREKVPQWRDQGDAVLRRNVEAVREKVDAAEKALRDSRRGREADELRKRFDEWLRDTKTETVEEHR